MPAALQCPDCGHQEMLDHLGGVSTFRCGGCGRALKVPAQFRDRDEPGPAGRSRPPSAGEPTQAMPRIGPGAVAPEAGPRGVVPPGVVPPSIVPPNAIPPSALPSITPAAASAAAAAVPGAPFPGMPVRDARPRRPPAAAELATDGLATTGPTTGASAPVTPASLKPPLILRLILWAIALPLGSLIVFAIASSLKVITKAQLEDTFLLSGWGRFLPIARLLPFCALATALIVQFGVFGLERLRVRNLRKGPPGRSRARPGSTRPHTAGGGGQRPNGNGNGARSRDRVIS